MGCVPVDFSQNKCEGPFDGGQKINTFKGVRCAREEMGERRTGEQFRIDFRAGGSFSPYAANRLEG